MDVEEEAELVATLMQLQPVVLRRILVHTAALLAASQGEAETDVQLRRIGHALQRAFDA